MRIFVCQACRLVVFFENTSCTRCGHALGYLPHLKMLSALKKVKTTDLFDALAPAAEGRRYRRCRNAVEYDACNWMIPADESHKYCEACRLTAVLPDFDAPEALERWLKLEQAKRRLLHSIDQLGLPLESRAERPRDGLAFVFLAQGDLGQEMVLTGHANGMVTINVNEADDPYREQQRKIMKEPYRTVLGHFRHEVGHYYWDRLIRDSEWLEPFRELFGDERESYADAVKRHYAKGPPRDWQRTHVSAYATMHAWEDWAETWSHYLHISDTLETARSYGMRLQATPYEAEPQLAVDMRTIDHGDFDRVIVAWMSLTETLNNLNRSMGLGDPYPFVLSSRAREKLRFVHELVRAWSAAKPSRSSGRWPNAVARPS
jgi:hypothetical protein